MEEKWIDQQEKLIEEKFEERIEEQEKQEEKWYKLLDKCLENGGPVRNVEESENFFSRIEKDEQNKSSILRNEILFRKKTREFDSLDYSVNKKTYNQLKDTLINILTKEDCLDSDEIPATNFNFDLILQKQLKS